MLLLGNAERGRQLPHYLTLLERGDAPGAALEAAFGVDTEGLSQELAAYVRRESLPLSVVEAGDIPSARVDAPERLDRADALTQLGVLLARTKDDPAAAEAHFRAALQADPARPLAEAGLASLLFKRKRYDEAVALYERALARDAREPSTNLLAAMALLDRFAANDRPDRDASVLPPEIARARALLGVVLEFRPNDPFVLGAYGTTWVYDPGDLAPGIRALEKALTLAPPDRALLFNLVQLHAAAGDAEKARAIIDGPLARVAEGDDLARARDALLQIDQRAAESAVQAGDLDKAIALLEQVRERTINPRTRTLAEARLTTLRSAAVRKAEIDRFNEAAELFNARTYGRARTILDALVHDAQNEDIRARAKELLTRIP
jgi:tetratricopeptide (TPR) repeat protein